MTKPSVFIGSSKEGLEIARAIQSQLDRDASVTIWSDDAFRPSLYALESLELEFRKRDYGVFVLTPDDIRTSRKRKAAVPRDNVIFELGLFIGISNRDRSFIVVPRDENLVLPSDLLGLNAVDYDPDGETTSLAAKLGSACTKIRQVIVSEPHRRTPLSWEALVEHIETVALKVRKSPRQGGFPCDLIIGVSRGGTACADLFARKLGNELPIVALWPDRTQDYPNVEFSNTINEPLRHLLADGSFRNILIVDDISRSGSTIKRAESFVRGLSPDSNLKTAVLIIESACKDDVDFYSAITDTSNAHLPYSVFD